MTMRPDCNIAIPRGRMQRPGLVRSLTYLSFWHPRYACGLILVSEPACVMVPRASVSGSPPGSSNRSLCAWRRSWEVFFSQRTSTFFTLVDSARNRRLDDWTRIQTCSSHSLDGRQAASAHRHFQGSTHSSDDGPFSNWEPQKAKMVWKTH